MKLRPIFLLACLPAAGSFWIISSEPKYLKGQVRVADKPVTGAKVCVQATKSSCFTDESGRFRLPFHPKAKRITAWKKGHAISAVPAAKANLVLKLKPLPKFDDPNYHWIDPTPNKKKPQNCGNCHSQIYEEWSRGAHRHSATNHDFLAFFTGDDWNVKKENPLGSGVCASCHAPTYRDPTLAYDMTKVQGVAKLGVHCDFCHKITDAPTDKLGIRFGKDGYRFLRNEKVVFGSLDDAYRDGEMFGYAPVFRDSRYCASCHEGVVFGVHAYGTYSEWKKSPAAKQGKHCQSCHMAPNGKMTNIAPGNGGVERDPMTLASHDFSGGSKELLRECLKVTVKLTRNKVVVSLHAENVGHRVPTGFVDRHLLLVVEAFDANQQRVQLAKGTVLPHRVGKALAGMPGFLYAKQLFDQKRNGPTPFWLPVDKVVDTRLKPNFVDRREFRFHAKVSKVRVRLIYRRFWNAVARRKKIRNNEIVAVDRTIS